MAKDKVFPKWQGKYAVVDADHVHNLETMAAINEFAHKMPRHEAEEKAHKQYMREQLIEAAAHHLAGIKAAQGAGDTDSIKRHGVMYQLAMRGLGHDPIGEPPAEVTEHMQHQPLKVYKFKPHPADAFAMPMWQHEIVGTKVEKSEGTKNMSRDQAGRFSFQGNHDRMCKCGRRLGEHCVEPPHTCGKCDGFKLAKADNNSALPPGFDGFSADDVFGQNEIKPPVQEEPWRASGGVFRGAQPGQVVRIGPHNFQLVRVWSDYEAMAQKVGAKQKMFNLHHNGPEVHVREQKGSADTTMQSPVILAVPWDSIKKR